MDKSIFKAYDIRGRYPTEINEAAAQEIASALAVFFKGPVVIGRDTRLSSPALYKTVGRALQKNLKVIPIGLTTTPMFYFLVNKLKSAGGVMVTASHNPKEWNGLKVVGKKAAMIPGNEILKLVQRLS